MASILRLVLPYAGVAGISIVIFYYLFREFIRKNIFPNLTREQAFRLLALFLLLVWLVAIFGIAAWVYHDLQTQRNNLSQLIRDPPPPFGGPEIVGISFSHSPKGQPSLDIKLRNTGSDPVYITHFYISELKSYRLKWQMHPHQQLVTWEGEMGLPDQTELAMSQVVPPKGTDRIQIRFFSKGRHAFFNSIFQFKCKFLYDNKHDLDFPKPITLLVPSQGEITAAFVSAGEAEGTASDNIAAIRDFMSRDTIRDPKFDELAKSILEPEPQKSESPAAK